VEALAAAAETEVLTLWSGLGYYSRARNLHRAARQVVARGGFPEDYAGIRALAGVGDYTAAAIASIAFRLPYAVVDGNVLRVAARVENDASDIGRAPVRERFREVAQSWLDARRPDLFNQAMMELGATVCLPRNPLCLLCPIASECRAREAGTAKQLPVKLRRGEPRKIEGALLLVRRNGRVLLKCRSAQARIMAGFWELPSREDFPQARVSASLGAIRHTITRHRYTLTVSIAKAGADKALPAHFRWFSVHEMRQVPLTTIARKALALALVHNL
jgi:A/G-specific adenine glycosylase